MNTATNTINTIRVASRLMVRELGFMNQTLAATDYSASAVHTLLEAEAKGCVTASQLVETLGLEKSSVSRLLTKLVEAGELDEAPSAYDGRTKYLRLTDKGIKTVGAINQYADERVAAALKSLTLRDSTLSHWGCHPTPAHSKPVVKTQSLMNTAM